MSKPELIKRSGQSFIAGAVVFLTILSSSDAIQIPGSVACAILLAVGMSGLRSGYRERIGFLGRNMLLLGISGPILWVIVFASMAFMFSAGNLTGTQMKEGLWVLMFIGPAISLLGLTLFGLTALLTKPMPRLNWLPLLTGIWYPVAYVLFSIYDISHKGAFPHQYLPAIMLVIIIQFFALCSLGSVLVDDSSKELTTA